MDPIHRRFTADHQFPFDMVYKDTKQPQNELPDHFHEWYEFVFVYKGVGRFFINHTFYEMKKGSFFLIPANTIHRAFPDAHDPITSTALFFSSSLIKHVEWDDAYPFLYCFEHAKKTNCYTLDLSQEGRNKVEQLLEEIDCERRMKVTGYKQAIFIHLQELLLLLNRLSYSSDTGIHEDSPLIPLWIKDILIYIDSNFEQDIQLSSLSQRACVSPAHFSRVFKQLTGMNVTEYILSKRIVLAKQWLLTSDDNIELIAARCGIESASYFYKTFKRLTKMTPTAYKRIHRA